MGEAATTQLNEDFIMERNAIDILNTPLTVYHILWTLCAVAVWFASWHLLLKRLLKKCKVTSFWYGLYELGCFGILAVIVFLLLIAILFIGSIQAVIGYGIKLLFPLFIFWGGFVTIAILIIRAIRKKK